jgi:hypothetical protein
MPKRDRDVDRKNAQAKRSQPSDFHLPKLYGVLVAAEPQIPIASIFPGVRRPILEIGDSGEVGLSDDGPVKRHLNP